MVAGDLIYPLLLESSNDAAEALAEHAGRTDFLRKMNQKASSIGMYATWYDKPEGSSYQVAYIPILEAFWFIFLKKSVLPGVFCQSFRGVI